MMLSPINMTQINNIDSPEREFNPTKTINKFKKRSSYYSNSKIKYKFPGLKKLDAYFPKESPSNENEHWKILQYNKNHFSKYIRKLPLFHLLPQDSSIFPYSIPYKNNTQRNRIKKSIEINHIQEKLTKSINTVSKKSFSSSVSLPSSPARLWLTKQQQQRDQAIEINIKLPRLNNILYQRNSHSIDTSSLFPGQTMRKSNSVNDYIKGNNLYEFRKKKNKGMLFKRNMINCCNKL